MKQTILIMAFVASYVATTAQSDSLSAGNPIETGFVFIDGKFIEPPYDITFKNEAIRINGIAFQKMPKSTYDKERYRDKHPGIPPELTKNTTWEEFKKMKVPGENKPYRMAVQDYYYSQYKLNEAREKYIEYMRSLPNVKSLEPSKTGTLIIETYAGEKYPIMFGGGGNMVDFNKMWGPGGKGKPSKEKLDSIIQNKLQYYSKKLSEGDIFVLTTGKWEWESGFGAYKASDVLQKISDVYVMDSSKEVKMKYLIEYGFFAASDTFNKTHLQHFIDGLNFPFGYKNIINKQLEKKGSKLLNEHREDRKEINELDKNIENNIGMKSNQRTINGSNKQVTSSGSDNSYSPYFTNIASICPLPAALGFQNESAKIIQEIEHQGFSSAANVFASPDPEHDVHGALTYNAVKYDVPDNYSFILLSSHGAENIGSSGSGISLIYKTNLGAVKTWLGYTVNSDLFSIESNENVKIGEDQEVEWYNSDIDLYYAFCAAATPVWFQTNWATKVDNNKAIVFLSTCFSYQNGCVSNCTNGNGAVVLGYNEKPEVIGNSCTDCESNNYNMLNRMNGHTGNGKKRCADAAYNDNSWQKIKGFKMYPSNAKNTLAPGIKDYYPKNNNQVSSHGDGFIELDTWCAVNIADNPVTFSTTSNVTISNIALVGEGNRTNKITFHWAATDNADWEVTATIDHTKIKSWSASAESHLLDADNVSPNDQPFTYKFRNASTIASLSFNGVIPDANPLEIEFTPVSNYSPNSFDWYFGDGSTSIESNPKHTYLSFGVYDVYLTAANSSGTSKTISQTVAVLDPSATTLSLECDQYPYSPQINQEVSIMGTITYGFNDGVSYTYLFQIFNNNNQVVYQEETTTSAPQAIIYTSYSLVGYYHIELTVFNNYSFSDNGFIQSPQFYVSDEVVTTQLMTTDFTITGNLNPNNYLTLTPSASGGLAPYHYFWQFGEDPVSGGGNYLGTVIPTNANGVLNNVFYPVAGIYPVWLFATDANMNSAQYYFEINIVEVNPPPVTFAPIIVEATPCMISHSVLGYGLSEYFVAANNTILGFGFELPYNTGLDACLGNGVWELSNLDWYDDGIRTQYCYNQNGNCMWEANSIYHFIPNTGHPNYFSSGYHYVKAEAYSIQGDGLNHCTGSKTIKVGIVDCSNPAYYSSNFFSGAMKYPDVNPIYISAGSLYVDQDDLFNSYVNINAVTLEACNEIVINHEFKTGSKNFILQGIPDPVDCNSTQINNNDLSVNNPTNRSMSHSSENNISETTDINEKMKNNTSLELEVFPNPAKDNTTIRFKLPNDDDLEITLIDMLGRKLKTITNDFTFTGEYELSLNTVNLSESIYTIVFKFGNQIKYIKLNKSKNL